jgi:programmed cell death protein 5
MVPSARLGASPFVSVYRSTDARMICRTDSAVFRDREREARAQMLNQILEPAAADRLGRIRLVKESRATDIENRLFGLARSGQLRQKVTEAQLKDLLNAVSEAEEERTQQRIVVNRRGGGDDDDLDDLLEGL